jgi:hypothetical protein
MFQMCVAAEFKRFKGSKVQRFKWYFEKGSE